MDAIELLFARIYNVPSLYFQHSKQMSILIARDNGHLPPRSSREDDREHGGCSYSHSPARIRNRIVPSSVCSPLHLVERFAYISSYIISFFSVTRSRANGTKMKEMAMFITGLV